MLAFFPIFILLGQLMGSVVVYKALDIAGSRGYKNCFISQWPFSALPLVVQLSSPKARRISFEKIE